MQRYWCIFVFSFELLGPAHPAAAAYVSPVYNPVKAAGGVSSFPSDPVFRSPPPPAYSEKHPACKPGFSKA